MRQENKETTRAIHISARAGGGLGLFAALSWVLNLMWHNPLFQNRSAGYPDVATIYVPTFAALSEEKAIASLPGGR